MLSWVIVWVGVSQRMEGSGHAVNRCTSKSPTVVSHCTLNNVWDSLWLVRVVNVEALMFHLLDIIIWESALKVICTWGVNELHITLLLWFYCGSDSHDLSTVLESWLGIKFNLFANTVSVHHSITRCTFTVSNFTFNYNCGILLCVIVIVGSLDKLEALLHFIREIEILHNDLLESFFVFPLNAFNVFNKNLV